MASFGWSRRYSENLERILDPKLRTHAQVREGDTGDTERQRYMGRRGFNRETGLWDTSLVEKDREKFTPVSGFRMEGGHHTYHGDPIVVVHTDHEADRGRAVVQAVRIDPVSGKPKGTVNFIVEQTGEGGMTHTRTTRGD